jgi:hypothetical protein
LSETPTLIPSKDFSSSPSRGTSTKPSIKVSHEVRKTYRSFFKLFSLR